MRDSVIRSFTAFSEPLEGIVYSQYADLKGLQTTGMGNLLPTAASASALPFRRSDGTLATRAEIEAEWRAVGAGCCGAKGPTYATCLWPGRKHPTTGVPCLAHQGWRASEAHVARLRLRREDVDALIRRKLASDWAILRGRWPNADAWPADAQLAVASWAWAVGPRAGWPLLSRALAAGDFRLAATQVEIKGGGTIVERNRRNVLLLRNAAVVRDSVRDGGRLDPDVLYWPADAATVPDPPRTDRPVGDPSVLGRAAVDVIERPR